MVGNDEQRFQLAKALVRSPILGEFYGSAAEVSVILLELSLEALKERNASAVDPANPARIFSW
jgi:hypothetical protein